MYNCAYRCPGNTETNYKNELGYANLITCLFSECRQLVQRIVVSIKICVS